MVLIRPYFDMDKMDLKKHIIYLAQINKKD